MDENTNILNDSAQHFYQEDLNASYYMNEPLESKISKISENIRKKSHLKKFFNHTPFIILFITVFCILFINIILFVFIFPFLPSYNYKCHSRFINDHFNFNAQHTDFEIQNKSAPLNYFKQRGTHNSYHKLSWFSTFIPAFRYELPPIMNQLNDGMRHLELDVHNINDEWLVYHIRYLDSVSDCSCLQECLSIFQSWRLKNKDHFPFIFWIEPKFKLEMKPMCDYTEEFQSLENVFKEVFGNDSFFRPSQLQKDYPSLRNAILSEGWPTVQELQGKIILTLAIWSENQKCGDVALKYSLDSESETRFRDEVLFFIASKSTDYHYASILEMNIQDENLISKAVDNGFIIRSFSKSAENPLRLDSKAQLLVGDNSFPTRPLHKSQWL